MMLRPLLERIIRPVALALITALMTASCAAQYGKGWLPTAQHVVHDPYGAYVHVEYFRGGPWEIEGELLAMSKDSLYLARTIIPSPIIVIPRDSIDFLRLNYYDAGNFAGAFGLWAAAGSVISVFTVGFYAVLAIPAYVLAGSFEAASASRTSSISYDSYFGDREFKWEEASRYARFPTGLPANFRRDSVHTRESVQLGY